MPKVDAEFLSQLLHACAETAPLYPARYAQPHRLDRGELDAGLDELRRRGLVQFTEWVKDAGQGYEPTKAGWQALAGRGPLPRGPAAPVAEHADRDTTVYDRGEAVRDSL